MPTFSSRVVARSAFAEYSRLEPELEALWHECRRATPPDRASLEDAFDTDAFDRDELLASQDDWCAEWFFFKHIKRRLIALVGIHRPNGPRELCTTTAYETVYTALFDHALNRSCTCCHERVGDDDGQRDDLNPAYP
ncbi:MAG TPA: hypothetical protein VGL61_31450 [Kofleriaceae bacterium]|jgi:hypothetical protein